jgi:F1F0 ATPase subunit 2
MMEVVVLRILAFLALGALLASAYLAALGLNVRLYLDSGAAWIALLVHTMRLLAIAAILFLCARQGALPLLSSLVGFQIVRTAAVNQLSPGLERKP